MTADATPAALERLQLQAGFWVVAAILLLVYGKVGEALGDEEKSSRCARPTAAALVRTLSPTAQSSRLTLAVAALIPSSPQDGGVHRLGGVDRGAGHRLLLCRLDPSRAALHLALAGRRPGHDRDRDRRGDDGLPQVRRAGLRAASQSWAEHDSHWRLTLLRPAAPPVAPHSFVIGLWPSFGLLTPLVVGVIAVGGMMLLHFLPAI